MEKAIVVYVDITASYNVKNRENALSGSVKELNDNLAQGWSVKQSCAMGGGSDAVACSLVILEKSD